ncbi:MAG TPA: B12-binding domain-containing radical SAM protein, partial [Candidatus Hydrogenedentes bacterium]|nr:B12-binding domain-containing radical SAM protein [Candidatus Hydrogenedentota bacterium]
MVGDLGRAPVPEKYIVPYTQLVHDGLALEVLRGCTQGCRFCHAGMTTRPVRERAPGEVAARIGSLLDATGLESATLVSLSTCDH